MCRQGNTGPLVPTGLTNMFQLEYSKIPKFKVKSLKREERQTTMLKGPDKFLEDAFNAADKKYALPELMLNSFLFTLQ